jgi:hypothetical protein
MATLGPFTVGAGRAGIALVALSLLLGEPLIVTRVVGGRIALTGVGLASGSPAQTRIRPTPEAGSTSRVASPS